MYICYFVASCLHTPWWVYYWLDVRWDTMSTKETLQKLLLISYPRQILSSGTADKGPFYLLLDSLRSCSLPRLVAGNVKYFCLLKINVDSPSDICFSRLLWTWPRNLMQELSILYLYNILYNIYQILNIVDISATRIKLTVAKILSSSLYKSSMK